MTHGTSKGGAVKLNSVRSASYRLARLLGDVQAVRKGRVVPRVANIVIGRKVVSKVWR
jgi:hypothetical protein